MNIDHISPSTLHITATENLNIQDDLAKEGTKTIAQLINEKTQTIQKDTDETQNETSTNS
jgi:hypothetical protein